MVRPHCRNLSTCDFLRAEPTASVVATIFTCSVARQSRGPGRSPPSRPRRSSWRRRGVVPWRSVRRRPRLLPAQQPTRETVIVAPSRNGIRRRPRRSYQSPAIRVRRAVPIRTPSSSGSGVGDDSVPVASHTYLLVSTARSDRERVIVHLRDTVSSPPPNTHAAQRATRAPHFDHRAARYARRLADRQSSPGDRVRRIRRAHRYRADTDDRSRAPPYRSPNVRRSPRSDRPHVYLERATRSSTAPTATPPSPGMRCVSLRYRAGAAIEPHGLPAIAGGRFRNDSRQQRAVPRVHRAQIAKPSL